MFLRMLFTFDMFQECVVLYCVFGIYGMQLILPRNANFFSVGFEWSRQVTVYKECQNIKCQMSNVFTPVNLFSLLSTFFFNFRICLNLFFMGQGDMNLFRDALTHGDREIGFVLFTSEKWKIFFSTKLWKTESSTL